MTNIGTPEPVRHVPRPTTPDSPAELPVTVPAPSEPGVPGVPAPPPPGRPPVPAEGVRPAAG